MFTIRLKDWSERTDKEDAIAAVMDEVSRRTAFITSADILPFTRPMIPGYGVSSGFEVYVQDQKGGTTEDLLKHTRQFIAALEPTARNRPRHHVVRHEVPAVPGRSRCRTLQTQRRFAGRRAEHPFGLYRRQLRLEHEPLLETLPRDGAGPARIPPRHRVAEQHLRAQRRGEMSPISQYLTLTRVYGSEILTRFNLFSSIQVNGTPATGYSSGQAIEAVREVAAATLPTGYGYEFGGMSREESSTGNTTTLVFVICVVFIYLILCALYESLFVPLAVILSVPFGLAGDFPLRQDVRSRNNIYLQTGLIMLIGLLSKTAILLTEYAADRRRAGMSIAQAAISAAKVRLRPILMTSLTMIFGMLPLMFASGVGANGNISIGVGTVGGMLIGTIALLFIVPPLFMVFQYLQERWMPERRLEETDLVQPETHSHA